MKLFSGLAILFLALLISCVAGYFSIIGLAHLFAGAFWPVVVMGSVLEAGKIAAATWLKANWFNPTVSKLHKGFLLTQTFVLMLITALGIYGFLAKGHLEQEAPLASVEIQIRQIEDRITQANAERARLEQRQNQLDQSVTTLMENAKTSKDARGADKIRQSQKRERADVQKQIVERNEQINKLSESMVPLKLKVSDVSAKLGPVKYVSQLFGWQDTTTAVQMVILMIMFVFDPLALVLIISGVYTLSEWLKERAAKKGQAEMKKVVDQLPNFDVETDEDRAFKKVFRETRGSLKDVDMSAWDPSWAEPTIIAKPESKPELAPEPTREASPASAHFASTPAFSWSQNSAVTIKPSSASPTLNGAPVDLSQTLTQADPLASARQVPNAGLTAYIETLGSSRAK